MDQKTLIEYLIDEENRGLTLCRKCASEESDPQMRTFLLEMTASKEGQRKQLEDKRRSLDASDSVTRQINDVYL
jgi:hypothetical protein